MKIKGFLITLCLFMLLMGCINSISAVSDDVTDIQVSEIDSNDEVISVGDDEDVFAVEQSGSASDTLENKLDGKNSLSSSNGSEVLKSDVVFRESSFSELQERIKNLEAGDVLYLTADVIQDTDSGINIISSSITIDGRGYMMDAKAISNIFNVHANNVTFTNITFTNSNSSYGAIYSMESVNVLNCRFSNCTSTNSGSAVTINSGNILNSNFTQCNGAISIFNGNIVNSTFIEINGDSTVFCGKSGAVINITNSTFINCTSKRNRAAVFIQQDNTDVYVSNSNFTNCSAPYYGAVILGGFGRVENSIFTDCRGSGEGGAVYIYWGDVFDSTFTGCSAFYGGAVYICNGGVSNSEFTRCVAKVGGAAYINFGDVSDSTFTDCMSEEYAGAISLFSGNIENSNFTNCSSDHGGAINIGEEPDCNIINSNFRDCTSTTGGAIASISRGLGIVESTFINCSSTENGGAVFLEKSGYVINSTFTDCRSSQNGGAVCILGINGADSRVSNSIFTCCTSTLSGGAIYAGQPTSPALTVYVENSSFTDCRSADDGGILCLYQNYGSVADSNFTGVEFKNAIVLNGEYFLNNNALSENAFINLRNEGSSSKILSKTHINVTAQIISGLDVNLTMVVLDDSDNIIILADSLGFLLDNGTVIPAVLNDGGIFWALFTFDATGNYNVSATGYDSLTDNVVYNCTFELKYNSPFDVSVSNISFCEKATFNISLPENARGNVTLQIGNETYTIVLSDSLKGNFTYDVAGLDAGKYDVYALYSGDDSYNSNISATSFSVSRVNPVIIINVEDIEIGSDAHVTAVLQAPATGNLTVIVNGKSYDVSSGEEITIANLSVGDYDVVVNYKGDKNYNPLTNTSRFSVFSKTPTINITVDYDNGEINITLPSDATGNVSLFVDEIENIVFLDDNGTAVFPITAIGAGKHSIVAVYHGDDTYQSVTEAISLTINKEIPVISIVVDDKDNLGVMAASNVTISIAGACGKLIIDDNGIIRIGELDENSTYSFEIYDLQAGEYVINVTYLGDDKYDGANNSTSFNVSKADSQVEIDVPATADTVQQINVSVKVSPYFAAGTVTLYIDGVANQTVAVNDGASNIIISPLSSGNHTIKVVYNGDLNYNANESDVKTIDVVKADIGDKISAEGSSVNPGETANVSVEGLPKDALGTVTVTIGNNTYNATVENGNAVVEIPELASGIYERVPVVYSGDDRYAGVTALATIIVKSTPQANITVPSNIKAGEDANITVSIPDASGNISVIVDGVETIVPLDENGTAVVPIYNATSGAHSVVVVYPGNEFIAPLIASDAFDVAGRVETEIVDVVIGKNYVIVAKLVDDAGVGVANAVVNYSINGVLNNTTTADDGSFIIFGQSNCVIDIGYAGDSAYMPTNTSVTIRFARLSTYIVGDTFTQYAIDYYAGERGGYFKVQLFDENGTALADKPVKIGFNGVVYNSITDAAGWAKLQINLRSAGSYTFAVGFLGDDEYTGSMEVYLIKVNKKPINIAAKAASYKASAAKKYTVTLSTNPCSSSDGKAYLASGKKVTLILNGVTYTAKTNADGQATFALKISKKGTYTASVNFAGDSAYNAASKSVKITIK